MNKIQSVVLDRSPQLLIKVLRLAKYHMNSVNGYTLGRFGVSQKGRLIALQRGYSQHIDSLQCDEQTLSWLKAYRDYQTGIPLVWADTPSPGNFGDWLSPYILTSVSEKPIKFISQSNIRRSPHYIGLGSIIGSANSKSTIIGAGISHLKTQISKKCNPLSVRGPYTNELLLKNGNDEAAILGDPGFMLPLIYQPKPKTPNLDGILLVRHINHRKITIDPKSTVREISIYAARNFAIEQFIDQIMEADLVVTSAMHCFITCLAYKKKVILFRPKIDETPVPGDGIKYRDALSGVGLRETLPIPLDLTKNLDSQLKDIEPYNDVFDLNNVKPLHDLYKRGFNV